jgi:DNA-binding NarL/FixJ family response regulator
MLQRYLRLSLEAGRVPSLMGRELFRGDVSHCTMQGFDDAVIFVHDVGNCIARLTPGKQHLVRRIALQGYSHGETAAMLGICHKTVSRHYASALDQLTAMLIRGKLLQLQEEALQSV